MPSTPSAKPRTSRAPAPLSNSSRKRSAPAGGKAAVEVLPGLARPDFAVAAEEGRGPVAVYVGDCRELLEKLLVGRAGVAGLEGKVDLVFADPPFNWNRAYDRWHDAMPEREYLNFTYTWLDLCERALRPGGAMWVNIPDDWAAEIVCHLKRRADGTSRMTLENWCVWHYRFGQNTTGRFINSKVHALYFVKPESGAGKRTWNPSEVLEHSDRFTTYFDPRTMEKNDGMPAGKRVPMDVWYGKYWGRIQGNNKERRHYHDNQLPEVYLDRVIRSCSNPGDLVLDPFLGSGTTGVVARYRGRRFIGTEFSPENAKSAVARIEAGPYRLPLIDADGDAVVTSAIHPPRRTRRAAEGTGGSGAAGR